MGKIKSFYIELDNDSAIYNQSDVVSGRVILTVEEDLKLKDVELIFKGAANVHWTEKKGTSRSSQVVHYKLEEIYFEKQLSMVAGKGEKDCVLKAGNYRYPFTFKLPRHIPPSYESKIGQVRYTLKASVDRTWAFDTKTEKIISVITPLDLNKRSDALSCAESEDARILCCWCCKSEPIIGKIHVDRVGYIPGEVIRPRIECINKTNRKMTSIDVSLIQVRVPFDCQVVSFHTKSKTKTVENTVVLKSLGPLKKGRSLSVDGIRLVVPLLPVSELQYCRIINIQYFLELMISPRKPAVELQFRVPIVIGSIALNVKSKASETVKNDNKVDNERKKAVPDEKVPTDRNSQRKNIFTSRHLQIPPPLHSKSKSDLTLESLSPIYKENLNVFCPKEQSLQKETKTEELPCR